MCTLPDSATFPTCCTPFHYSLPPYTVLYHTYPTAGYYPPRIVLVLHLPGDLVAEDIVANFFPFPIVAFLIPSPHIPVFLPCHLQHLGWLPAWLPLPVVVVVLALPLLRVCCHVWTMTHYRSWFCLMPYHYCIYPFAWRCQFCNHKSVCYRGSFQAKQKRAFCFPPLPCRHCPYLAVSSFAPVPGPSPSPRTTTARIHYPLHTYLPFFSVPAPPYHHPCEHCYSSTPTASTLLIPLYQLLPT